MPKVRCDPEKGHEGIDMPPGCQRKKETKLGKHGHQATRCAENLPSQRLTATWLLVTGMCWASGFAAGNFLKCRQLPTVLRRQLRRMQLLQSIEAGTSYGVGPRAAWTARCWQQPRGITLGAAQVAESRCLQWRVCRC